MIASNSISTVGFTQQNHFWMQKSWIFIGYRKVELLLDTEKHNPYLILKSNITAYASLNVIIDVIIDASNMTWWRIKDCRKFIFRQLAVNLMTVNHNFLFSAYIYIENNPLNISAIVQWYLWLNCSLSQVYKRCVTLCVISRSCCEVSIRQFE